jgi:hypothetical protein
VIRNSNISNSTLEDVWLENADISDGVILGGMITLGGIRYNIDTPIALSQVIVGSDVEDNTLVGVFGTRLNVNAEKSDLSLQIAADRDYVTGSMLAQKSLARPNGTIKQPNNLDGYTVIEVSENLEDNMAWAYIVFYYNQSDVDELDINESSIRVEFYNESSEEWEEITPGGVNVAENYAFAVAENYAFANSTHFTVFGLHGNIRPTPVNIETKSRSPSRGYTPSIIPSAGTVSISSNDLADLVKQFGYARSQFFISSIQMSGPLASLGMFSISEELSQIINAVAWKKARALEGDSLEALSEYVLAKYPKGSKKVVVARGDLGPDACASVAYARSQGIPILLVETDTVPAVIQSTLNSLGAENVVIVGGRDAVSEGVESTLPGATRIAGFDRFETAVEMAQALLSIQRAETLVITDGLNPDMLSVIIASYYEAPLIYTKGDSVPPSTIEFLAENRFKRILLVGISERAENEIRRVV